MRGEAAGSGSQETGCQGGWDQELGPGEQGRGLGEGGAGNWSPKTTQGPDAGVHGLGEGL